jgi:hypothetical protein
VFQLHRANNTAAPHISGAFPLDTMTVLPFAKACLRRAGGSEVRYRDG